MTRGIKDFDEVDFGMKDSALEIIGKKKIAAASDVENRACQFFKLYFDEVCYRIVFYETAGLYLHAEGIQLCQILIVCCLYHIARSPVCTGDDIKFSGIVSINRFQHRCRGSRQV